jgi:FkbM family methyltransferase
MSAAFNSRLKKHAPKLHQFLKQTLARTKLPVPRLLLGRPVWTHYRLLNSGHNEPHVLRWIAKALRPGDICFDVGAHHGWMSMVAARQTGQKGRVVAFEPAPSLVEFLSYHKRINRLSQMDIVPKAVSHRDGTEMPFHLVGDGNSFMNSLLGLNIPENSIRSKSSIEFETVTLDTFSRLSGLTPI